MLVQARNREKHKREGKQGQSENKYSLKKPLVIASSHAIDELKKHSGTNKIDFKDEPKTQLQASYKETNTEPN